MGWPCLVAIDEGSCDLLVSVMPNAKRTQVAGLHDGALRVRLAAPPVEGRANEALVEWLAGELAIARREVVLRHGASGRRKRLRLACEPARVSEWLQKVLPDAA